jgi:hypothetical protein
MGTDVSGLPSPAVRAGDGRYHIPGSLTTAPPTILKKVLEVCNTLVEKIKQSNVRSLNMWWAVAVLTQLISRTEILRISKMS